MFARLNCKTLKSKSQHDSQHHRHYNSKIQKHNCMMIQNGYFLQGAPIEK